jgi:DNA-binding PadR family transcriptional regulator
MGYVILTLLAGTCAAILLSIIRARGRYKYLVLMLLLENWERGGNYLKISFGKDPEELAKVLNMMVRQGYLEEKVRHFRLTPKGIELAIKLRKQLSR